MTFKQQTAAIPADLMDLFHFISEVKQIKKGTILFSAGQTIQELYVIRSGNIQISKPTSTGNELALRIAQRNDIIGEISLTHQRLKYVLTAKALDDAIVDAIPKTMLEQKLLENNKLAIDLMKLLSIYNLRDQTKFRDLVLYGTKGALYSTLIRLANSYGRKINGKIIIDLPLTNQDLANFCGTSREYTNRLLSELKKKQKVSTNNGFIIIHNLDFIKREIDCENCPISLCNIH